MAPEVLAQSQGTPLLLRQGKAEHRGGENVLG